MKMICMVFSENIFCGKWIYMDQNQQTIFFGHVSIQFSSSAEKYKINRLTDGERRGTE